MESAGKNNLRASELRGRVEPRNWVDLKRRLVKLEALREFEFGVSVRADSVGFDQKWRATRYRLAVTVESGSCKQFIELDAFCQPLVRVLGVYRIPGRSDRLAVVSRIGRAYGCEEVETPVLLQAE